MLERGRVLTKAGAREVNPCRRPATMDGVRRGERGGGVIEKNERRVTTLAKWHSHAPPKSEVHWKD